jgi:hypothetical protein
LAIKSEAKCKEESAARKRQQNGISRARRNQLRFAEITSFSASLKARQKFAHHGCTIAMEELGPNLNISPPSRVQQFAAHTMLKAF